MSSINYYFKVVGTDNPIKMLGSDAYNPDCDYPNTTVKAIKGLQDLGKPNNIHTRQWAGSNKLDVLHPTDVGEEVTRDPQSIEIILVSFGTQYEIQSFLTWVANNRILFWDNYRSFEVEIFNDKEIKFDDYILRLTGNRFQISIPFQCVDTPKSLF